MIDATFVEKIVDLARVQAFAIGDKNYTSSQVYQVEPKKPDLLPTVSVSTLTGFGDLVKGKLDSLDPQRWLIHVASYCKVSLIALAADEHGRRTTLIDASPVKFDGFQFGQWIDQEHFIIQVASRMAETDDRQYVLSTASSLTNEAIGVSEDDGFTQKATVKAGIKHVATATLKPTVQLAPFRTFPDVGQPISPFVYRAKNGQTGPSMMLVEADGGKWKIDAMAVIKQFLEGLDLGIPVIA